jgi:hypothetical protein
LPIHALAYFTAGVSKKKGGGKGETERERWACNLKSHLMQKTAGVLDKKFAVVFPRAAVFRTQIGFSTRPLTIY